MEAAICYVPLARPPLRAPPVLRDVSRPAPQCSSCSLRTLCLPGELEADAIGLIDQLVATRRRIKRGEILYRAGDMFKSIYAVRSGFFKASMSTDDGREQVTGFHMSGELIGIDGIGHERHRLQTIALEDSEVCVIPFARLEEMCCQVRSLQQQFHRILSQEILRDQTVMLLGGMRAEQRVAAFLLNLSQRFAARGYAAREFNLRMTREEIGSYLGLKLETVSRIFSKLQKTGHIEVQQKGIRLLDPAALKNILQQAQEI